MELISTKLVEMCMPSCLQITLWVNQKTSWVSKIILYYFLTRAFSWLPKFLVFRKQKVQMVMVEVMWETCLTPRPQLQVWHYSKFLQCLNLELLNRVLTEKDKTFPLSPSSALFLEPIILLWQRIVPSNSSMSAIALLYISVLSVYDL